MKTTTNLATVKMRDRDLLFSGLLILGSIGLILYALSISLQAMKRVNATFYDAPGFSMIVVGCGLLILGCALLKTALSQGGTLQWLKPRHWRRSIRTRSNLKTVVVFVYLFLYMFGLGEPIPGTGVVIPFWILTFVFLVAMMATFRAAHIGTIVITSGLCILLVTVIFGWFAKVPLP